MDGTVINLKILGANEKPIVCCNFFSILYYYTLCFLGVKPNK